MNYETISIIRPNAGEDAIAKISERTAEIIGAAGGEIIAVDKWGLKKLAYPIKKEENGYFVYTVFSGNGAGVDEMERIFRIDDDVLKYMTVRLADDFVLPEKKDDEETVEQEEA
ncbi:MAG: 30S ribosomal protein S6 [Thermodesulfobacteriota bacterium]